MDRISRRAACLSLLALPALPLGAQDPPPAEEPAKEARRPDSFTVYAEAPRLFLRPARLKLLRRERERQLVSCERIIEEQLEKYGFLKPPGGGGLKLA